MTKLDFIDKPINPPPPYKFNVISTFAGCGGSSLGYKWAGGKVLAAVEWDTNAVETYLLNHKGTHVLHRDIAEVSADELLALCGLHTGELDILDGSPPCQGFSTAGKRIMDDPRNQLFREFVRLLAGLQPKVFIMENVSGMVKGKMKLIFADILRELKAQGYTVKAWLLNAMYFGVPQSRQRMIFIGVRNDLGIVPTCPKSQSSLISVTEAIGKYGFVDYRHNYSVSRVKWARSTFDNPSLTIIKTAAGWKPCIDGQSRLFTASELKRLSSYPDSFQLVTDKNAHGRIGNSVPPRFMQAIAEYVYETILEPYGTTTKTNRPETG